MVKRFEEDSFKRILGVIESISSRTFTEDELKYLAQGAGEAELVESGLKDTMVNSYNEINELRKLHNVDLRTAALISAITKVRSEERRVGNECRCRWRPKESQRRADRVKRTGLDSEMRRTRV